MKKMILGFLITAGVCTSFAALPPGYEEVQRFETAVNAATSYGYIVGSGQVSKAVKLDYAVQLSVAKASDIQLGEKPQPEVACVQFKVLATQPGQAGPAQYSFQYFTQACAALNEKSLPLPARKYPSPDPLSRAAHIHQALLTVTGAQNIVNAFVVLRSGPQLALIQTSVGENKKVCVEGKPSVTKKPKQPATGFDYKIVSCAK